MRRAGRNNRPAFGDSVIVFEGAVHHLALNLEHYGLDPYVDGPLLARCFAVL